MIYLFIILTTLYSLPSSFLPSLTDVGHDPVNNDIIDIYMYMQWRKVYMYTKRKRRNFDDISSTGCTESCQSDTLRCNQWQRYRESDDVSFSLKWNDFNLHYHGHISQRVFELINLKVQRNKRKTVAPLRTIPNHIIILHMLRQFISRGMCNTVTWLDHQRQH